MKILGHRVLIKMLEVKTTEKKSGGGVILALDEKIQQEDSELAEVIQIGPTAFKELGDGKPWVNVGDIVTIQKYAGKKMVRGNIIYRCINDEDLLTIEDKE